MKMSQCPLTYRVQVVSRTEARLRELKLEKGGQVSRLEKEVRLDRYPEEVGARHLRSRRISLISKLSKDQAALEAKLERDLRRPTDLRCTGKLGWFIRDCCIQDPRARCRHNDLFLLYSEECHRRHLTPVSSTAFGKWMRAVGFGQVRVGTYPGYSGVALLGSEIVDPPTKRDCSPAWFLEECCVRGKQFRCRHKDLYATYVGKCHLKGVPPVTSIAFGKWMRAAGFKPLVVRHYPGFAGVTPSDDIFFCLSV